MTALLTTPLALRIAWTLVHFLWQGTLLGLVAWGGLAALRGRNSRLRYGMACTFLALCALAPLATFLLLAGPSGGSHSLQAPLVLGLDPAFVPPVGSAMGVATYSWQAQVLPWLPSLLMGWMIGTALLGLRAAGGWFWLQHLRRQASPVVENGWTERVEVLALRAGIKRTVRLLQSARVRTPMALGVLRPVILVPLGFFAQVDALGAEAVLAHELAHLRRMDPLVNGLQCLLETLLFFHPAVHFISRRVRTERECCCDDEAVLACGDAILYVETLSRLDALRSRPLSLVLSARGGNLMERIKRLLAPTPVPRLAVPSLVLVLVALGATALLAQAPKKPSPPPAPSAVTPPPAPLAAPAPPPPAPAAPVAPLAADPWGDKGDRAPFQLSAESLHEAILKFAEARKLDAVIGSGIQDRRGVFIFRHSPWREALDGLAKAHGLVCVVQNGILRVAYPQDLQNEAQWARQLAPRTEPRQSVVPVAPEAPQSPAPEASKASHSTVTTYVPTRRVKFTLRQGKEGTIKLRIETSRVSREELLEALRKIEHLAKAGVDVDRPLQGEWVLPSKEEHSTDLLTFDLDGVTTQSVRELYK